MLLTSTAIKEMQGIPGEYALCVMDASTHVRFSSNRNPDFAWTEVPAGTRSLVLICHDPDVPSRGEDVNREGRIVPASLPRVDFFHWLLVDLPVTTSAIKAGEFSNGITPRGKPGPAALAVSRQGINDYTNWFASDKEMAGNYFGYDGPCPPWNDEVPHRYIFTLYAVDIERLPVEGAFTGDDVRAALTGHVLADATLTGRYSLNPDIQL